MLSICNNILSNKKFELNKSYEIILYITKIKLILKKQVDYE